MSVDDRSLEHIRLLAAVPPEVRRQVENLCGWRRFDRGDEIISHQAVSQEVFLIARGCVRVHIHTISGREITFEDLEQGAHFGHIAAIDGKSRSASVTALRATTVACMSGHLFIELCHQHPAIALAVMRDMADIMRRFNDRLVELSTLGAHNRVHAELLRLARAGRSRGDVLTIRPIPRHADIAARVCTARETVARVLADLTHQEIVERGSDALVIRDPKRLSSMVEDVLHGSQTR